MFWKIKVAFKQFIFRLKHPIHICDNNKWDGCSHEHVCIAARLLTQKNFTDVCPKHGKCEIELDDRCDTCRYLKTIRFYSENVDGFKHHFFIEPDINDL